MQASVQRVDSQASAALSRCNAVGVVQLVSLERCHLADVGFLVSCGRLAGHGCAGCKVAGHAVVIASAQGQITLEGLNALLVENGLGLRHIVEACGGGRALHDQRALLAGDVHHGHIDVTCQLLLCSSAKAVFLQRVAQLCRGHDPWNGLAVADGRGYCQLCAVAKVGGLVGAVERLCDVGLWPPDLITCALHHRLICVVDRDVVAQYEGVIEAFKDVLERYALLFAECICHFDSSIG